MDYILKTLNYTKANLGNFPSSAFDRPIGYKLTDFGHSQEPSNIDADAEGSACPVGGIGAGAFEWTMSGNFRYWFLKLGWMVDDTVWANQFHVYMKKGNDIVVQTLSTDAPASSDQLRSWEWEYPEGKGNYYALFPKSGFSYQTNDDFPVWLAVTQFSPGRIWWVGSRWPRLPELILLILFGTGKALEIIMNLSKKETIKPSSLKKRIWI
jgi:hypothetical protein